MIDLSRNSVKPVPEYGRQDLYAEAILTRRREAMRAAAKRLNVLKDHTRRHEALTP
jgi:hypothetical protein